MQTAAGSAWVGTERLRGLLESDRLLAEEVRARAAQTPLQTTDHKVSLRLRMKRRFRENPRVYSGSLIASASLLLVLLVAVVDPLAGAKTDQTAARIVAQTSHELPRLRSTGPLVSHQPRVAPALHAPLRTHATGDRLLRARRVLRRTAGPEGAAQARVMLEDLLRAKPKNGRAYAALAEACLRLEDAACARTAATKAVARQPRRVSYRALAARVDRTFDQAFPSGPP